MENRKIRKLANRKLPMAGVREAVFLFPVLCLLLSATGCEKLSSLIKGKGKKTAAAPPQAVEVKGTVVARVNNQPITLEELNEEIENYNKLVPEDRPESKINTSDKKFEYLNTEVIRRLLLAQAAVDRGLDRREDVQDALENFKQNLLAAELMREETKDIEASSKEIEDYYNSFKEQLREPEERRLREIVVSSESEARDILIELLKGADFAALAQARSISASAKNGGDLGYIKKGAKPPQFDDVAFSSLLEAGRTSNYFKGPEGYYILKLEAKRGGAVPNLSAVWDDIKNGLTFLKQRDKVEKFAEKLRHEAKIELMESLVK